MLATVREDYTDIDSINRITHGYSGGSEITVNATVVLECPVDSEEINCTFDGTIARTSDDTTICFNYTCKGKNGTWKDLNVTALSIDGASIDPVYLNEKVGLIDVLKDV